jgi:1-deoxy-D-xylulose-5-phosphate synthase
MVLCTKVPGMTVMAPSSYQELQVMMSDAVTMCAGPVSIRWPKTSAVFVEEDEVGSGLTARKARPGSGGRVCLIGVGKMLAPSLEAAEMLADDGIDATVWDPRIVVPLDPEMVGDAARHDVVVTIEDGFRQGGAGTGIETALRDMEAECKVEVMGVPVMYIPHAKPDKILREFGLDARGIAATVQRLLS